MTDIIFIGRFTVKYIDGIIQMCGAGRDRTDDLLNAIQALSQLSYGPKLILIDKYFNDLPEGFRDALPTELQPYNRG